MKKFVTYSIFLVLFTFPLCALLGQDTRSALREGAAKWKPLQSDVEMDLIADEEIPLCDLVISDDARKMKLLSPQKIVLRNFADTDGDSERQVDQWSYYLNGVEVFRELDTTGNGKRDQFRWLNSAGTRWGIDENGDGKIDRWKEISAEEVSREIVLALATKDARRFLCVALKEDELKSLELGDALNNTVARKVAALQAGFTNAAASVALTADAEWHQLSAVLPSVVPKGEQGNQKDLRVYENAAVTISDGGNVRQVVIGTLVQIGDNNWRILDLPKNYDEEQTSFTFIQPVLARGSTGPADSEIVTIMNQVAALQAQIPNVPAAQRPAKHKQVITLLLDILQKVATQEERENWIRQIADTIMEAAAREEYPDGKEQIATLFESVNNRPTMLELAAHVRSRQIMVNYYAAIAADGDPMKGYTQWLVDLEEMVNTFPKTEAGLEGMMQLASYKEMLEPSNEESIRLYERVIELVPGQPQATKAKGAIRRLTAEGKEVPFRATDTAGKAFDIAEYKGKFVLLCFWDTYSSAQLPIFKAAADRFEAAGLVTVGVNVDFDEAVLRASLAAAPPTWRQLYAPGGLDGELARYWGVMTPPCMILYDKEGKVVRSSISTVEGLQQVLTELVK